MTGDDPGHASAVAETLAQATDEELEAAGIDSDRLASIKDGWRDARKKRTWVEFRGPYTEPDVVKTLEGDYEVDEEYIDAHGGYVIIKGVNGELYPCGLDIFKETYDVPHDELEPAVDDVFFDEVADIEAPKGPLKGEHTLAVVHDNGELTPVAPNVDDDHVGREADDTEVADQILREALLEESNSDPDVADVIDERYTTAVADGSDIMGTLHLEGQEFGAGVLIDVQRLRELVDVFEREFDEDQRHGYLSFVKHEQDKPILTALRPTGYDQDAAVLVGPNGGNHD